MNDTVAIIALVVFIVFSPLILIWALNTLLALGIAYTLKTYFGAALLLIAMKV